MFLLLNLLQDIVSTIYSETQYPVHKDLGMFVLIIASHGAEGSIIGSDSYHIKLTDIYKLISAKNFPAMSGKPKLVIIQACATPHTPSTCKSQLLLWKHK